jgi:hypothetical protein
MGVLDDLLFACLRRLINQKVNDNIAKRGLQKYAHDVLLAAAVDVAKIDDALAQQVARTGNGEEDSYESQIEVTRIWLIASADK